MRAGEKMAWFNVLPPPGVPEAITEARLFLSLMGAIVEGPLERRIELFIRESFADLLRGFGFCRSRERRSRGSDDSGVLIAREGLCEVWV